MHDRHVDLDPEDRVGGELGQPLAGEVGAVRGVGDQHVARDPLLLGERTLVELAGTTHEVAQGGDLVVLGGAGGVLELTGPLVVADQVGVGGLLAEVPRPVLVGQLVDAGVLLAHGRPLSWSTGSRPSFAVVSSRICTLRIFPVTVIGNSSTSIT